MAIGVGDRAKRAKPRAEKALAVIRYKGGAVDDVAISGDLMRLEQMDDAVWWLCVYRGQARTAFSLRIEGQGIVAEVIEDSIGCHDDSQGGGDEQAQVSG